MDSQATAIVILAYGTLVLVGGVIGFLKAKSKASLIAGGVSGIVLMACAFAVWQWTDQSAAYWLAVALTIVLLMFFGARFAMTKAFMPSGLMAALSLFALVLIILAVKDKPLPF